MPRSSSVLLSVLCNGARSQAGGAPGAPPSRTRTRAPARAPAVSQRAIMGSPRSDGQPAALPGQRQPGMLHSPLHHRSNCSPAVGSDAATGKLCPMRSTSSLEAWASPLVRRLISCASFASCSQTSLSADACRESTIRKGDHFWNRGCFDPLPTRTTLWIPLPISPSRSWSTWWFEWVMTTMGPGLARALSPHMAARPLLWTRVRRM
mmetsp:Transcript_18841/g.47543  ORF Transcript_18841/g.47543 Transcript_18841/m.47543 type:complete len:207 (-) Transcript_18841:273-893(-)